ncbi:uncharacterized protein LOC128866899 [Anastrepha ludens]|uniref:uncharacterized protein LOC128866899 n=1 Tax=Anastrepha ludens TaxID=28586 RepID=UPI0023B1299F|nr:uncharacterized protein LOC128866899 [Anastrepha ludens]
MHSQIELVDISLSTPNTPNTPNTPSSPTQRLDQATGAILNYMLGDTVRERDEEEQDAIVEESVTKRKQTRTAWPPAAPSANDGKPQLRYFAVGPSTYQIRCPLCKQRADTETVQMAGIMGHLSCLLSTLSCCFPIFSLSFVYVCLQSRLKSKRMFCNRCGGHLGFFWRPT